MKGSEIFRSEISAIHNKKLGQAVAEFLNHHTPAYFYVVPSSSTGKYHPWYSNGFGGLVRHTKAAVKIAVDLLSLEQNKHLPADEIIAALILHDTFKYGLPFRYEEYGLPFRYEDDPDNHNTHTTHDHPLQAADAVRRFAPDTEACEELKCVACLISSHMGQWTTNSAGTITLPKPENEAEKFVHMCDYLASRKYITVEVE